MMEIKLIASVLKLEQWFPFQNIPLHVQDISLLAGMRMRL